MISKKFFGACMFLLVVSFLFVHLVSAERIVERDFVGENARFIPGFDLEVPSRVSDRSGDFSVKSMNINADASQRRNVQDARILDG
jgi:hypothetical protein